MIVYIKKILLVSLVLTDEIHKAVWDKQKSTKLYNPKAEILHYQIIRTATKTS